MMSRPTCSCSLLGCEGSAQSHTGCSSHQGRLTSVFSLSFQTRRRFSLLLFLESDGRDLTVGKDPFARLYRMVWESTGQDSREWGRDTGQEWGTSLTWAPPSIVWWQAGRSSGWGQMGGGACLPHRVGSEVACLGLAHSTRA